VKKRKVLLGSIVIIAILLSGCIDNSESPPSYPSKYAVGDIDIELVYEPAIFYFGDVVQDNGSVNQSKTVDWALTINNRGNRTEEVRFEISHFPRELLLWPTKVAYKYGETIYPDYDYSNYDYSKAEFERYYIEDIVSMASVEFTVSITFNKTVAWSYSPDTTYVGHFEIRKHAIDPKCGNSYYERLVVPFVVRT